MKEQETHKIYVAELADKNYYNPFDQIVRVKYNGRILDFRLGANPFEVPNPSKHVVLVLTSSTTMEKINECQVREDLLPGYKDTSFTPASIPFGAAFIMNKDQSVVGTNPQNGSAGFAIENTNMFDLNKVRISISPTIQKSYTNNDLDDSQGKNIGVFINDDTVLVKSKGASLTLGEDGIHIGGKVHWESTKHNKEFMVDNPFHGFIPQTIVTPLISLPYIPNIGAITNMSNTGNKVMTIINKTKAIINVLDT